MTGKQTCDTLKKIRRDIVEYNNFDIQISDCPHGNDVKCPGTCPKCEAEAKALERAINKRKKTRKESCDRRNLSRTYRRNSSVRADRKQ